MWYKDNEHSNQFDRKFKFEGLKMAKKKKNFID